MICVSEDLIQSYSNFSPEEKLSVGSQCFYALVQKGEWYRRKVDRNLLAEMEELIDEEISEILDDILHNEEFQKLESTWKGLEQMLGAQKPGANVKVELLSCSKIELQDDFEDASHLSKSGLYRHVYTDEYDTPGGEPFASILSLFEMDSSSADLEILQNLSKVGAAAHTPVISAVKSQFFFKEDMMDVSMVDDLEDWLDRSEFLNWKALRDCEDSKYLGLILPKVMLRAPWSPENFRSRFFNYIEKINDEKSSYLWGNPVWKFGAGLINSFQNSGWCVQIRGPESGGRVENLPLVFDSQGVMERIPTEMLISETREFELAQQGFIPLSYYRNHTHACFFSANSVHRPMEFLDPQANANARINSRLPYIFLCSRLAHYLKVIQRESVGSVKDAEVLQGELNAWLKSLVTKMQNPDPAVVASHPLREAEVEVQPNPENPGFFKVSMRVQPHFQVEGVDVQLSLVSKIPQKEG